LLDIEQLGPQRRLLFGRRFVAVFGTMPGNKPSEFIRDDSNIRQDLSFCNRVKGFGSDMAGLLAILGNSMVRRRENEVDAPTGAPSLLYSGGEGRGEGG
jgi:hypothetical protein